MVEMMWVYADEGISFWAYIYIYIYIVRLLDLQNGSLHRVWSPRLETHPLAMAGVLISCVM